MILFNNARIYTMDERKIIGDGFVLVDDKVSGKIIAVGEGNGIGVASDICGVTGDRPLIIDVLGGLIFPGFIDIHCHLGLWEDGQRPETGDGNEMTDPVTPHLRAIDAINPLDKNFREAVEGGVTSVLTGPGSANVIAGQFAHIKTVGSKIDDMTVNSCVAMKAALGENPKGVYGSRNSQPGSRMGNAAIFREALIKARIYMEDLGKHLENPEKARPEFNMKHEALIPVLKRELPLKIHCHRADDILTAVRICNEFNLLYTLDHCTEGYRVAEFLAVEQKKGNLIGVINGPLLSDRSKPELAYSDIKNPGILNNAGVKVAIMTDHPVIPLQYLPISAGVAAREGMGEMEALEAITSEAASICGSGDRLGSIKIGYDADLVILSGHPFDLRSRVMYTVIDGKIVYKR